MKRLKSMLGDTHATGDLFENLVETMFPDEYFSIVHKTISKSDLHGRGTETSWYPDFRFRDRETKETFWVECKYRSDLFQGALEWCDYPTLKKYKQIRKETGTKVYVMIGLAGKPTRPERLFCLDLDDMKYTKLYKSVFEPFEIGKGHYISCVHLKALVEEGRIKATEGY